MGKQITKLQLPGRFVLFSLTTHVHSVNDCTWCFSTFFLFFFLGFFSFTSYCFLYFLGVSLELREGPDRHVFRSLRGRHSKGKGKEIEGARPRARDEGKLSFSLARTRASKFPHPLPLLMPATQATYFEYRSPHVRNSGFQNLETFAGGIWNPKNFCLWIPDSGFPGVGIRNPAQGIRNPSFTDKESCIYGVVWDYPTNI